MNLSSKIVNDMRTAMKLRNKEDLVILRMLVSSLENEKFNKKLSEVIDLSDNEVIPIIKKQVKVLDQELDGLKKAGRSVDRVTNQKLVLLKYLPVQMTENELKDFILIKIEEIGITSIKEQGKLMGVISKELKETADLGLVSKIVRELLQ